ncbi:CPBP family intramembrane metalloprotease [Kordia sp. YSTF-M3]|uniref:CPBP family intramembrane metalloprotease n=1 Tax=Kordia aestuariivivens TaxID=2759037 RepID=A0ABR7Q705_9FLAO|nr:CPBP family intramembrane glutamic endopeptidase [Kordia aestuariivivens]MBC8754323.1 CPBP family intramembrane metalloprotease [Kordia aestuariivivens]
MITKTTNHKGFLFDLIIYIAVMFLIREVSIPNTSFLVTGLFWSFTTLIVASWRMKVRNVSWKDVGLTKPKSIKKTLLVTGLILVTTIICLVAFNIIKDQIPFFTEQVSDLEKTTEPTTSKFGNLKGNWWLFLTIMPMVLIESCLEELLDRGFLINWFEKLFSQTTIATLLAVVLQAAIFGFRHSYDLSERSITVGIIGLIMGIAYVKFGRNLWPLILAHCILNTISMIDRV